MNNDTMSTKKALLIVGSLVFIVGVSVVIPAKWLGVKPKVNNRPRLDLTYSGLINSRPITATTWKGLTTGNIDPIDVKKLELEKPDPMVIAQLNDPNNLTSSFSKKLYVASTYMAKNPEMTDASKQKIINELVAQEAAKIIPTVYAYKDLHISKSESKESVKKYGNDMASILDTLITEQSTVEDLACIMNFTKSKDAKDLAIITKDYKKADAKLKKLVALSIPLSAASYHLLTINRVAAYRDLLYNLSQASEDPMRTTLFLNKYTDRTIAALRVYGELTHYFDFQHVVFSAKDPGYVFTVGYTGE